MLFKAAILFLVGLTQVLASRVDENLIVLNTEEKTEDTLTIHGEDASVMFNPFDHNLQGSIECGGDHKANVNSCRQLIQGLINDGGATLPNSPRSLCVSPSGNQCCVSWSKVSRGLQKSDLVNSANKVLSQCSDGFSVSALERSVELHGTTGVTQCLSNRPDGCA